MAIRLQDGIHIRLSDLLNGNAIDPDTGKPVIVSQVGSTNTFTETLPRGDGANIKYRCDASNDPIVVLSRTIE